MKEDIRALKSFDGIQQFEKEYEKPHCILLDSEYSSMGRMIGSLACKEAGFTYYDAVILLELVPEEGVTMEDVKSFEAVLRQKKMSKDEIHALEDYERITNAFDKAIKLALEKGPCLIHDRATKEMIEKLGYSVKTVLTYATDLDNKIVRARLSPLYENESDDAKIVRFMEEEDNIRINYHTAHSDTTWGDKETYDLCINSEELGRTYSAKVLAHLMNGD